MLVYLAQREADVDQYVIAHANLVEQSDIDIAADAAHLHFGDVAGFIRYLDNPARNRKTHCLKPPFMSLPRPIRFDHSVAYNRLTERDTAVIGRHAAVSEDFEAGGFEQSRRSLQ